MTREHLDDYVANHTEDEIEALLKEAEPFVEISGGRLAKGVPLFLTGEM